MGTAIIHGRSKYLVLCHTGVNWVNDYRIFIFGRPLIFRSFLGWPANQNPMLETRIKNTTCFRMVETDCRIKYNKVFYIQDMQERWVALLLTSWMFKWYGSWPLCTERWGIRMRQTMKVTPSSMWWYEAAFVSKSIRIHEYVSNFKFDDYQMHQSVCISSELLRFQETAQVNVSSCSLKPP